MFLLECQNCFVLIDYLDFQYPFYIKLKDNYWKFSMSERRNWITIKHYIKLKWNIQIIELWYNRISRASDSESWLPEFQWKGTSEFYFIMKWKAIAWKDWNYDYVQQLNLYMFLLIKRVDNKRHNICDWT